MLPSFLLALPLSYSAHMVLTVTKKENIKENQYAGKVEKRKKKDNIFFMINIISKNHLSIKNCFWNSSHLEYNKRSTIKARHKNVVGQSYMTTTFKYLPILLTLVTLSNMNKLT